MSGAPALLIHAGAGGNRGAAAEHPEECREALARALACGRAELERGGDALGAVEAAVMKMESCELFNAGRGSALCADGSVAMSAALMRSDRAAGAMAELRRTKHPISGALAVLHSPQVLMVGDAADAMAERFGVAQCAPGYFVTERQRNRLHEPPAGPDHATVGAVALDAAGVLAAGTSTGGIRAQPPGRVGDTPLIGAGTWADEHVAVSCTGDGEAFVRAGAGRYIGALLEAGVPVHEATERALAGVGALGGSGGLIALAASGAWAMPFSTPVMPRAMWRAGEAPQLWPL